jgi:tRNA dimethylallyltransferase
MPTDLCHDCWFLSGPTAAGKTAVGIELARRIDAEIVSLDSMALYRGMDLGTAKPTADERKAVPHHLIDVIEPDQEYSLAQYVAAARQAADDIRSRARQVLFLGGTPLYLKGLLRGIFEGPPADWEFRKRLVDEACQADRPPGFLHRRLAACDPAAAARLHPNDARRIIRALEVFEKTGTPISALQQQFDVGRPAAECRVFVLDWPREPLYERINRRVEWMFSAGLVEEVRSLLDRGKPLSRTAGQALGYREVIEHLQGGRPLAETIEVVKTHTRQFAKRQGTWFRSLSECRGLPVSEPLDPAEIAGRIAEAAGGGT